MRSSKWQAGRLPRDPASCSLIDCWLIPIAAHPRRAQESLERLLAQQRARFEAELAEMASAHDTLERSIKAKQAQFNDELGEKLKTIHELEQLLKEFRAKLEAETAEFAAAQAAWALERDGLQVRWT